MTLAAGEAYSLTVYCGTSRLSLDRRRRGWGYQHASDVLQARDGLNSPLYCGKPSDLAPLGHLP